MWPRLTVREREQCLGWRNETNGLRITRNHQQYFTRDLKLKSLIVIKIRIVWVRLALDNNLAPSFFLESLEQPLCELSGAKCVTERIMYMYRHWGVCSRGTKLFCSLLMMDRHPCLICNFDIWICGVGGTHQPTMIYYIFSRAPSFVQHIFRIFSSITSKIPKMGKKNILCHVYHKSVQIFIRHVA